MWTAIIRAAIALVVVTFLAWLTPVILDPMLEIGMAGDYSTASEVTRTHGYLTALTETNLTLIGVLAVSVFLVGRAAVERRLG